MKLTPMQYIVAALAQAHNDDMTLPELIKVAGDSKSPEDFDQLVNTFTNHTRTK